MAAGGDAVSVEEALAWEAEQRPRAGLASILAGLLLIAGFAYGSVGFTDSPSVTSVDGLRNALGVPLADGQKGLLTDSAIWTKDNAAELLATTAVSAIGTVLIAFALGYLFRATVARRPETSRFILALVLIGPILSGIGPLVSALSAVISAGNYVDDGVYSTIGAHDALRTGSGVVISAFFGLFGNLAIAGGILFLALNAMRVGLLTRFVGILGCIVGALLLLPLGPPVVVESAWLLVLGVLILGRVRNVPRAWATGRAEPWPSQQELREQRDGGVDALPPLPAKEPVAVSLQKREDGQHPASKKRKRKRR